MKVFSLERMSQSQTVPTHNNKLHLAHMAPNVDRNQNVIVSNKCNSPRATLQLQFVYQFVFGIKQFNTLVVAVSHNESTIRKYL